MEARPVYFPDIKTIAPAVVITNETMPEADEAILVSFKVLCSFLIVLGFSVNLVFISTIAMSSKLNVVFNYFLLNSSCADVLYFTALTYGLFVWDGAMAPFLQGDGECTILCQVFMFLFFAAEIARGLAITLLVYGTFLSLKYPKLREGVDTLYLISITILMLMISYVVVCPVLIPGQPTPSHQKLVLLGLTYLVPAVLVCFPCLAMAVDMNIWRVTRRHNVQKLIIDKLERRRIVMVLSQVLMFTLLGLPLRQSCPMTLSARTLFVLWVDGLPTLLRPFFCYCQDPEIRNELKNTFKRRESITSDSSEC